jgi:hypothetical protein
MVTSYKPDSQNRQLRQAKVRSGLIRRFFTSDDKTLQLLSVKSNARPAGCLADHPEPVEGPIGQVAELMEKRDRSEDDRGIWDGQESGIMGRDVGLERENAESVEKSLFLAREAALVGWGLMLMDYQFSVLGFIVCDLT